MRLFTLTLILFSFSFAAQAQTDDKSTERRYYNSQGGYGSQIYNSQSSNVNRGPLSIKQLLKGTPDAADGSQNSYYGGSDFRPYGMDEGHSLALSPSQVTEARNRRNALARQQEQDAMRELRDRERQAFMQEETDSYVNQLQESTNSINAQAPLRQPLQRRTYQPRNNDFEKPKKVFNSIY